MKIMTAFAIVLLLGIGASHCQESITKEQLVSPFGFKQQVLPTTIGDVVYYTYQKGFRPKTKLVLYIHGSDPSPLFSYNHVEDGIQPNCFLPRDFEQLSEDFLYVGVEKVGFEGVFNEDQIEVPDRYVQTNSLTTRVTAIDAVIDHLITQYTFDKVIVYGHSEGAPVAAKLATQNKHITHLGFWAGNALPDFYDFILENRIAFYKNEISDDEAQQNINETINGFVNEVASDTSNTEGGGYTNLRWWSYAEPPINNLLKIEIPIFVQVATLDESAPIESTYLIPLEFARLKKNNLTYNVCTGCDHSFYKTNDQDKKEALWSEIFTEFIEWTDVNR